MANENTAAFQEGVQDLKETVESVKGNLNEAASTIVRGVGKFGKKTKMVGEEKIMQVEKEVEDYMKKFPLRFVLGAVGVGLVIGWLAKRTMNHNE